MSIFTPVSPEEASAWLARYDLGDLLELKGITAGVENTNYFLTTTRGRFVLTLFERLPPQNVAIYLDLMAGLAQRGLPCPAPMASRAGSLLGELQRKPAALVTRLPGRPVATPAAAHCAAIGNFLGRMHRVAAEIDIHPVNPRSHEWYEQTARAVAAHLDPDAHRLLAEAMARLARRRDRLPRGVTHADLFRDNALFGDDGKLQGVIDFYFAAENNLLFDVAVAANDWCLAADGVALDGQLTAALLHGYDAQRPLLAAERAAWREELCAAALRFWLSRLFDHYQPRDGAVVGIKDPEPFRRILAARAVDPQPWFQPEPPRQPGTASSPHRSTNSPCRPDGGG